MKPSKNIINEIEKKQKRLEQALNKLRTINIDLIAEAFPQGYWNFDLLDRFEFCLPFSFDLIDTFKKFMSEQCPDDKLYREWRHVWDEYEKAGHFLYYKNFQVSYRTEQTGTTCILNKIGETNKTVPIYEVICQDGANE